MLVASLMKNCASSVLHSSLLHMIFASSCYTEVPVSVCGSTGVPRSKVRIRSKVCLQAWKWLRYKSITILKCGVSMLMRRTFTTCFRLAEGQAVPPDPAGAAGSWPDAAPLAPPPSRRPPPPCGKSLKGNSQTAQQGRRLMAGSGAGVVSHIRSVCACP